MTRRTLLSVVPCALAARAFDRPIGLNLYTVRGPLAKSPAQTYQALGKAGIQELEVRPPQLIEHAAMIRDAGMKPVHMFIESASITGAWDEWRAFGAAMASKRGMPAPRADAPRPTLDEMIELARKHGIHRIGTSMLLPGERASAIEAINRAAARCGTAGLELYYHNHAFEFAGARGSRFFDRLRKELDPRVRLELDTFWAAYGGDKPTEILRQWKGRVRSVHLKDLAADAPRGSAETDVPQTAFRELGQGTLDLRGIIRAARGAGVEHYFIELDYSPGDPIDSVNRCVAYLKSLDIN
ncbi:MAG: sugar phosphate isomerase/epimerase [Bryobacteraceae bacterium]